MASVNAGNPNSEILNFKNFLGKYGHETPSKRDRLQRSVPKPLSLKSCIHPNPKRYHFETDMTHKLLLQVMFTQ